MASCVIVVQILKDHAVVLVFLWISEVPANGLVHIVHHESRWAISPNGENASQVGVTRHR